MYTVAVAAVVNILSTLAEPNALVGQRYGTIAAHEQNTTQFILQIADLAGKGRLGHVQHVRCFGNAFLARDRKKIP